MVVKHSSLTVCSDNLWLRGSHAVTRESQRENELYLQACSYWSEVESIVVAETFSPCRNLLVWETYHTNAGTQHDISFNIT